MRIGITGANSVLGRAYARRAYSAGHEVSAFVRSPISSTEIPFILGSDFDFDKFAGLDCIIHLAWDRSRNHRKSYEVNISGANRVIEACKKHCVYPHLVSTMSVYAKNQSNYGFSKSQAENIFSSGGGTYVRAGLVWGGEITPIIKSIRRLSSLPLICPHMTPTSDLYHSFQDALIDASLSMCVQKQNAAASGDIVAEEPVSLEGIIHAFNSAHKRLHVRIPSRVVYGGVRILEKVHFPLPFRSDSIASVFGSIGSVQPHLATHDVSRSKLPGNFEFMDWLRSLEQNA